MLVLVRGCLGEYAVKEGRSTVAYHSIQVSALLTCRTQPKNKRNRNLAPGPVGHSVFRIPLRNASKCFSFQGRIEKEEKGMSCSLT